MPPSRTVAPYSPARTPPGVEAVLGHRGHPPPFIRDTNPLERLNREIGRRTDVVGIFPDDASLIRLATSLVIEQNDEWLVGRRYLSLDSLAPLLEERSEHEEQEVLELTAA
jgi:putative transposase